MAGPNLPTYTPRFGFGQAFSNAYNKEQDRQFQKEFLDLQQKFTTKEREDSQDWQSNEYGKDRIWRTNERIGGQDWQSNEDLKRRSQQQYQFNKNYGLRKNLYEDITRPEAERRTEIYDKAEKHETDVGRMMLQEMAKEEENQLYEQLKSDMQGKWYVPNERDQLFNPLTWGWGDNSLLDLIGIPYESDMVKGLTPPAPIPKPQTLNPSTIREWQRLNATVGAQSNDNELYNNLSTGGNMIPNGFTIPK